ncbi:TonB-dependent receptor [Sphingomonas sp. LaA6.9]|uniref:TonB-dependent receptor n=1 Tax=Sphingomonas sp. LaA6.9 TaxID=2919914 RepID=UPI001F4FBF99|nr:TonB-dependent receptor [Sphingomonas sp. LaA6.9]MCJ8156407.1 TonB-dependent receptor [Sphingomonas sp. LaA6.9]
MRVSDFNPSSNPVRLTIAALLGSTMLATSATALAQDPAASNSDVIIVTAQKREENLQDVPIAITAIGTEKLEQLQVTDFDDYARYLPSVSYQTTGPGGSNVYFRGVASGENANHSASLPSVGMYLDEQPITTIQGNLDIHVYDIARVEALAGPQGTLYGASSEAGTIRIITNKPDTSGFYGAADVELNSVSHGGEGYIGEAFINAPLSDRAAVRIVGWYKKDAGYLDNIPASITFPTSGITFDNAPFVEKDYNDVETYGGRAALRIDLDDDWTITPTIMGQKQVSHGLFAQESGLEPLQVAQFNPERFNDRWYQAALTIEGKIGSWDLTYAGAYLNRRITGESDYVDYSYFYDALFGYGAYFYDNNGDLVNPNQYIQSVDRFEKISQELRFASPAEKRVRFVGGLFYQRQEHNIEQNYIIDNIADSITVAGTDSNIWLTKQLRVDRDYAAFGEITADVTDKLSATMGTRIYYYKNSLVGFFGYQNPGYSSNPIYACQGPVIVKGSPCTNLDKQTSDTDFIHKLNVTYKFTDDALVYGTVSRGFRPGGINRRGSLPPYQADFVDNYELGFKTSWWDNRVRLNAAIYQLDWTDVQLSFIGANGLTEIRNAGNARIRGGEFDFYVRAAEGLTFNLSGSYNDAKITEDFCDFANQAFDCTLPGPDGDPNSVLAPAGTRLPITAKFKGNAQARYQFEVSDSLDAFLQGTAVYEGRRTSDLRLKERDIIGDLPDYTTVDLSAGLNNDKWSAEIFVRNLFDSRGQVGKLVPCDEDTCGDPDGVTAMGPKIYTYLTQPRTIGIKLGTKF